MYLICELWVAIGVCESGGDFPLLYNLACLHSKKRRPLLLPRSLTTECDLTHMCCTTLPKIERAFRGLGRQYMVMRRFFKMICGDGDGDSDARWYDPPQAPKVGIHRHCARNTW